MTPTLAALTFSAVLAAGLPVGLLAQNASPESAPPDSSRAEVFLDETSGAVVIRGAFVNEEGPSGALAYRLVVEKRGQSGTSKNRQGGRFETAPGRTDTLSTVRLGVGPGDRVEVRLTVLDAEAEAVAESRLTRTF